MSDLGKLNNIRLAVLTKNDIFGHKETYFESKYETSVHWISGSEAIIYFIWAKEFMNVFKSHLTLKILVDFIHESAVFLKNRERKIKTIHSLLSMKVK